MTSDQRLGARTEDYTVIFKTDAGSKTYTTGDYKTYSRYSIGSRWKLNLNALGGIINIDPFADFYLGQASHRDNPPGDGEEMML